MSQSYFFYTEETTLRLKVDDVSDDGSIFPLPGTQARVYNGCYLWAEVDSDGYVGVEADTSDWEGFHALLRDLAWMAVEGRLVVSVRSSAIEEPPRRIVVTPGEVEEKTGQVVFPGDLVVLITRYCEGRDGSVLVYHYEAVKGDAASAHHGGDIRVYLSEDAFRAGNPEAPEFDADGYASWSVFGEEAHG